MPALFIHNTSGVNAMEGIFTIIGVIIGFLLSSAKDWMISLYRNKKIKRSLRDELVAIYSQIELKVDVINQMKSSLLINAILPGNTTPIVKNLYLENLNSLSSLYNRSELNLLHVVYNNLMLIDNYLSDFEMRLRADLLHQIIKEPFENYSKQLDDILLSYNNTKKLIESFLNSNVIEVFPPNQFS